MTGIAVDRIVNGKIVESWGIFDQFGMMQQLGVIPTPEEVIRVHDSHSVFYTRFLSDRTNDLNGGRQREASLEIEAEIDNIRAAWSWAVEHSRVETIEQSAHPLFWFCRIQSRSREGISAFEKAAQMLDNGDPRTEILLAGVLCSLGWMCIRVGAHEQAKAAMERSWLLYSQHSVLPEPGRGQDPRMVLGYAHLYWDNNISMAEQLARDAVRDHTLRGDHHNLAAACIMLAMVARVQGKYEEARQYTKQAYACTLTTGDEFTGSYCLREWGTASQLLGDTEDAKRRLQASYAVQESFGDLKGMADTLTDLGRIALFQGDNAECSHYYEQAQTICHDRGDYVGLAAALEGLGNSARAMGHYGEARRCLGEALQISHQHMSNPSPTNL